jgi:hypothetical protein
LSGIEQEDASFLRIRVRAPRLVGDHLVHQVEIAFARGKSEQLHQACGMPFWSGRSGGGPEAGFVGGARSAFPRHGPVLCLFVFCLSY